MILCGISGVEENPLFPEEILRHLSGLMYWMKIRGLNNQIHIIKFYHEEKVCNMILHEFGLYSESSHIINGHTPVRTSKGEHPVRAKWGNCLSLMEASVRVIIRRLE